MINSIRQLEQDLRDLLMERGHHSFPKRQWYQLVAPLDNVGDTTLAIASYQRSGIGRATGTKYLRLFGYLQSVYLQQDSIEFLSNVLTGQWADPEHGTGWAALRLLRNQIGGHPAERAAAVARITMSSRGFKIVHWESWGPKFEDIDLHGLHRRYVAEAAAILNSVVDTVKIQNDPVGNSGHEA